ncbi:putative plasmid maintenance toxin/cell growth inhibitor [Nostoc sp. NIES-4103]|nr:putative plasmid maintenance toxin/cell growth inhibitor [Nostoc sp. NIES-4103]
MGVLNPFIHPRLRTEFAPVFWLLTPEFFLDNDTYQTSSKVLDIWLVRFPFSNLTSTKLRPALVLAVHREEVIILGIFSKIPAADLRETWVLVSDTHPQFSQTGLKKTSLIRADKIATVNELVFERQLGILPSDMLILVQEALKKSLNIN